VSNRPQQRGFTLVEVLIALALISAISLVAMGAITPWIGFKQKLDTERRLQDVRNGMLAMYDRRAMEVEAQVGGRFAEFTNSVPAPGIDGLPRCDSQMDAFATNSMLFSEFPQQLSIDGYSNPWCIFISNPILETRDNVQLWYRNIAVVSLGPDGVLEAGTALTPAGVLSVAGDDLGVAVTGRDVQAPKLKDTLSRLNRVAQAYENFFTARYLAYADRDITRYYFADGGVATSGNTWQPVGSWLAPVGVGGFDAATPWESNNTIEVNNGTGAANGTTVRTPWTSGSSALPYTALLRARVPTPPGAPVSYALQVAVGNY